MLSHPWKIGGSALLVVVLAASAWFGVQAVIATRSLQQAADEADRLRNALIAGDDAGAQAAYAELGRLTERARSNSDGPLWAVVERLPSLGRNAEAVSTIASAVDDTVTRALPPIMNISAQVRADVFTPKDGVIDLTAMAAVAPSLAEGDQALTEVVAPIDDIDAAGLYGRLREPVAVLQRRLQDAQSAIRAGAQGAQVLPTMLGAEGPKDYLLLFQTNAEIRSLGGVVGSWAVVHAEGGAISMVEQGGSIDVRPFEESVTPLSDAESQIYNTSLGGDLRNTTMTPDFPRAAQLAREIMRQRLDIEVDGVVAVDPVALSFLLAGTGPLQLPDGGGVSAETAVQILLNGAYLAFPEGPIQDDFFEGTAKTVFDAVRSGQGSAPIILSALGRSVQENRLMVWTADEAVQQIIAPTGISGALSKDAGDSPHVGVYLSDGTATKMEYYLDYATRVVATECSDDRQTLVGTTSIRSTAPLDAATSLPSSVTGPGILAPKGSMRVTLRFYAPFGGEVTTVKVDGEKQTVYAFEHDGRPVSFVSLQLDPGSAYTIEAEYRTGPGQTADGVFSTTPGIASSANDTRIPSACG